MILHFFNCLTHVTIGIRVKRKQFKSLHYKVFSKDTNVLSMIVFSKMVISQKLKGHLNISGKLLIADFSS